MEVIFHFRLLEVTSVKVVYLPGILGSNLSIAAPPGRPLQRVWLDLDTVWHGGLAWLDLADDGVSPGPLAGGA